MVLPPTLTGRSPTGDPEVLILHQTLAELNRKLMRGEIDIPPEVGRQGNISGNILWFSWEMDVLWGAILGGQALAELNCKLIAGRE